MKKIYLLLAMMLAFTLALFAVEPVATGVGGVPIGQQRFNLTLPQKTTSFQVTGAVLVDTVTTAINIPKYAVLTNVYVTVTDTVESRGDSALVKILCGTTEIFSQMTSAFKLGVSTAPRTFYFAPTTIYTPLAGGTLSYRITQAATSGTEGITEGTFKINVGYFYP